MEAETSARSGSSLLPLEFRVDLSCRGIVEVDQPNVAGWVSPLCSSKVADCLRSRRVDRGPTTRTPGIKLPGAGPGTDSSAHDPLSDASPRKIWVIDRSAEFSLCHAKHPADSIR